MKTSNNKTKVHSLEKHQWCGFGTDTTKKLSKSTCIGRSNICAIYVIFIILMIVSLLYTCLCYVNFLNRIFILKIVF